MLFVSCVIGLPCACAGDDLDEIVSKAAAEADGDGGNVVRDTRNVLGGFAKFLGALSR